MVKINIPERFPTKSPLLVHPLESRISSLLKINNGMYFCLDELREQLRMDNPLLAEGQFHIFKGNDDTFYFGAQLQKKSDFTKISDSYIPFAKIVLPNYNHSDL